MHVNRLTEQVIGAAIIVHRELGPGLLESAYEKCMAVEMAQRGLPFERQFPLKILFKQVRIDCGYRVDFLVDPKVVVELKAVSHLEPIHSAQILTYLKLSGCHVGLLINFNVHVLRNGVHRLVRGLPEPAFHHEVH
ncbi:MAG: GxxExxY protein [Gemmatimonadota bacterium]|jgi:GxxExxY protein